MSKTNPTRIHLLGDGRLEEAVANASIMPGMLLANSATQDSGGRAKVILHGTAGGPAERNFAIEDALQGRTIADTYVADELVQIINCNSGDVVYGWLAVGENVTTADFLSSNGDGRFQKATGGDTRLAVPLDDLDLSDSDATHTRLRVRVL